MPYEYTPPKYAQVIAELQRRIESGEYPPGSLLPSEHQLSAEFGTARPTVVRALRVLRQEGWIDTQQGKGSFVRGRPALAGVSGERRGEAELDRDESREPGELVSVGMAAAPPRIAALLGSPEGQEVLCRRRLVRQDGDPSEIVTWWFPPGLAERTGLAGRAGARRGPLPWPGARACGSITWWSRSPPGALPRMRSSCSASPVGPGAGAVRARAGRVRAALFALDVAMPVTCTSWRTPTPSART